MAKWAPWGASATFKAAVEFVLLLTLMPRPRRSFKRMNDRSVECQPFGADARRSLAAIVTRSARELASIGGMKAIPADRSIRSTSRARAHGSNHTGSSAVFV
jgi:hypothetical protein